VVIVGLLIIALICVVTGIVLTSAPWLIASLIATGGAGYLIVRNRRTMTAPAAAATGTVPADGATVAESGDDADAETAVLAAAGGADEDAPHDEASPRHDVWVIDGRPRYHLEQCAIIKGQEAEPIPWDQATEDGFMPCSLCEPDSILATGT
jgi:hypothetical protein